MTPMSPISSLCVYCGSSPPAQNAHRLLAQALGHGAARRGIALVYGGGHVGMMGIVADAALAAGGKVTGVIPEFLVEREVHHRGLTETVIVDSMHARKQRMFELADGFAILPGGLGTLDEAIEVITWKQLGLHQKPIFLVDAEAYWQPFTALIDATIAAGYTPAAARDFFRRARSIDDLFTQIEALAPLKSAADARRL